MSRINLLILIAFLTSLNSCGQNSTNDTQSVDLFHTLSPIEYQNALENREIILIDVRTAEEYATGAIANAKNIDYLQDDFESKILNLDRNRPIYVYCKVGGRSGDAVEVFRKNGFHHVVNLKGGIMAWSQAKLPLTANSNTMAKDEMSFENYQKVITENEIVLVDFYAPWCKPCQRMKPLIEELEKKYSSSLRVLKLDYDKNLNLAKSENVTALPMIIVYRNGKKTYSEIKEHSATELEALMK
jgi:thioredoxin 1